MLIDEAHSTCEIASPTITLTQLPESQPAKPDQTLTHKENISQMFTFTNMSFFVIETISSSHK